MNSIAKLASEHKSYYTCDINAPIDMDRKSDLVETGSPNFIVPPQTCVFRGGGEDRRDDEDYHD